MIPEDAGRRLPKDLEELEIWLSNAYNNGYHKRIVEERRVLSKLPIYWEPPSSRSAE